MKTVKEGEFAWEYKGRVIHLYEDEIYYFHSEQRKTYVHTANNFYEGRWKLGEVEERFQNLPMIRTHHSFLVHMKNLELLHGREVIMKNGEHIPVSESHRKQVFDAARIYFFGRSSDL